MFGKIKQQARSQGLHVLLMDMGQTANYPLDSAVSVKRWNVPDFQNEMLFSTSSSSFLLVTRVLPHSTQDSQQRTPGPGEQAEEAPCPWPLRLLLGQRCPHVPPVVSPCPSGSVPTSLPRYPHVPPVGPGEQRALSALPQARAPGSAQGTAAVWGQCVDSKLNSSDKSW